MPILRVKARKVQNRRGFRPALEACERRELLAVVVTSTLDDGSPGTLRDAINQVNAGTVPDDTVNFQIDSSFASTIVIESALPIITHRIHIDGLSQSGSTPNNQIFTDNANLNIAIDGNFGSYSGFVFGSGSAGSSINGLAINHFGGNGIVISDDSIHVFGNYIGVSPSGSILDESSNTLSGVNITGFANSTIGGSTLAERNLISGNGEYGIVVGSSVVLVTAVITGNFIGTDATGGFVPVPGGSTHAGNLLAGIRVSHGQNNSIGGSGAFERNIISGNQLDGVVLGGGGVGNVVRNNYVGLTSDGTGTLANGGNGIFIGNDANATVGGIGVNEGNVISGNGRDGLRIISNSFQTNTLVLGNTIGLDPTGTIARANGAHGIVDEGHNDTIGAGNLISANTGEGVLLGGDQNVLLGSTIGLNANGLAAPNGQNGVLVTRTGATIGGNTQADFNVISGNDQNGIRIIGSDTVVRGNFIGLSVDGLTARPNQRDGVIVDDAARTAILGGYISGNLIQGIHVVNGSRNTRIQGAVVGLAFGGSAAVGNGGNGIVFDGGTSDTNATVGGVGVNEGNVISANGLNGLRIISNSARTNTLVLGNTIGLNSTGLISHANGAHGIFDEGHGDTIGAGNLISANTDAGVWLAGTQNVVLGSTIGLNANGLAAPNGDNGVLVTGSGATIGGDTQADTNVISGNSQNGVRIVGSDTVLLRNFIGLSRDGLTARPNQHDGVIIDDAARTAILGGYISGNRVQGIHVVNGSTDTRIEGTVVGLAFGGSTAVGNGVNGIVFDGAFGVSIGGSTVSTRNVISGNGDNGILVFGEGSSASAVKITSNYIGLDTTGEIAIGNATTGIALLNADSGSMIGAAGSGNWIAGNGSSGIYVNHFGPSYDPSGSLTIVANVIGIAPSLESSLPNRGDGIWATNVALLTIGGADAGLRNVISNNGGNGIRVDQTPDNFPLNSTTIQGNYLGLSIDGTRGQGNKANGIAVFGGNALLIGGDVAAGNWIANNQASGIYLDRNPSDTGRSWQVMNNVIGLNRGGEATGNASNGITIDQASNVTVGPGNVISSNFADGILVFGENVVGTSIVGNSIGTGLDGVPKHGVAKRGNGINGVDLYGGNSATIGGAGALGNVIGFNQAAGVLIRSSSRSNSLFGNKIGVDPSDTAAAENGSQGVLIEGSPFNRVGSLNAGEGNVISGNKLSGVQIQGGSATGNVVVGNTIGLTFSGTTVLNNGAAGVWIWNAPGNTVGADGTSGTTARNLFSGNNDAGVRISDAGATANQVLGNWFGLAANGSSLPASGGIGVLVENAAGNTIGAPNAVNVVSNQSGATLQSIGIYLAGTGTTRTVVQSNRIGTDATGTSDRGNNVGLLIENATGNTIGGANADQGNVISGNDDINLSINGGSASSNVVNLNIIGLAANGQSRLTDQHINDPDLIPTDPDRLTDPRSRVGLQIQNAPGTLISNNTVTDNRVGIGVNGFTASGTTMIFNRIGTDANGQIVQAGQGINSSGNSVGIFVNDAPGSFIGRPGQGNLIMGNQSVGIEFFGPSSRVNIVQANTIGASDNGIYFDSGDNNVIGGLTAPEGNLIVGNRQAGVFLFSPRTFSNVIASNRINDNGTFGVVLFNAGAGNAVVTTGASRNTFLRNRLGTINVTNSKVPAPTAAINAINKRRPR